jgi:hypothetical protein
MHSLDQQPPGVLAGPTGVLIKSIRAFHIGQGLDRLLRDREAETGLKKRSPLPGCPAGFGARRRFIPD